MSKDQEITFINSKTPLCDQPIYDVESTSVNNGCMDIPLELESLLKKIHVIVNRKLSLTADEVLTIMELYKTINGLVDIPYPALSNYSHITEFNDYLFTLKMIYPALAYFPAAESIYSVYSNRKPSQVVMRNLKNQLLDSTVRVSTRLSLESAGIGIRTKDQVISPEPDSAGIPNKLIESDTFVMTINFNTSHNDTNI